MHRSDSEDRCALPALNVVVGLHQHQKKVTPHEEANLWLPLVHIMIGNMKKFSMEPFCFPDAGNYRLTDNRFDSNNSAVFFLFPEQ